MNEAMMIEHRDLVVEVAIDRGMLDKIVDGHRVVPVKWIEDYYRRHQVTS